MEDIKTIKEILDIIRDLNLTNEEMCLKLDQYHESDIADVVPLLTEEERDKFFSRISNEHLGELLTFVESPEDYIEDMDPEKAADIVETMDADDAVDILEEMEEDKVQVILDEMEEEQREDIELIKTFDEDEIGSKITTNFIVLNKNFSIKEAMKALVREAPDNDNIYNLFVLDDDMKYYGTINLKDLIIAREGTELKDITRTNYPTLYAHEKVADCINELKDIDLDIIPVLAENDTILGVITSQDIIETVDDEMTEDYVKFAAISEDTDEKDNIFQSVLRRVPWLVMLLVLNIFTSSVLSGFSGVFIALPFLVLFQSWILGTSGNAGTQSLALTIRAVTEDKLDKSNFLKYVFKELLTGLLDGLLVGICGFIVSFVFLQLSNAETVTSLSQYKKALTALIVGGALFLSIPLTSLCGLFIPVLFKKMHIDPAVSSGPLITTLSDMFGATVYYSTALLMINLFI